VLLPALLQSDTASLHWWACRFRSPYWLLLLPFHSRPSSRPSSSPSPTLPLRSRLPRAPLCRLLLPTRRPRLLARLAVGVGLRDGLAVSVDPHPAHRLFQPHCEHRPDDVDALLRAEGRRREEGGRVLQLTLARVLVLALAAGRRAPCLLTTHPTQPTTQPPTQPTCTAISIATRSALLKGSST
jgi:hypothetical protein